MDTQALEIKQKLAELENALIVKLPTMPTLLQSIHRQLKKDPEVVTLLTEEECGILVSGLKKQTSTVIATSALKTKTKAQSRMTVDDL
jgi:hypothetical protein